MRRFLELGGLFAGLVLMVFGVAAVVLGVNGHSTVASSLKQEQIVGTSDMTPAAIKVEAQRAGLTNVSLPTCNVANQRVTSGTDARCFAQYMRIHALEATGGFVYAQMGQYTAKPGTPAAELMPGGGTSNSQFAVTDSATKQPVANGARNVWVTETALATALDTSYMASQLAVFGIVVGVALLLAGLGFVILAVGGALRNPENVLNAVLGRRTAKPSVPPLASSA
jgi:hypothetical protein